MYAVVVADDEPLARKGLQTIVDWESLGCRLVGVAENGEQAVEMVVSHDADILITDVRMPGMDGHQVIQKARSRKPDLLAVIVSGYDEFGYVRQALTIGVENYILKPLDRAEMYSTISSAVSRLEAIQQSKRHEALLWRSFRDSVMTRLVHGEIGQIELFERLSVLGLRLEGSRFQVLICDVPNTGRNGSAELAEDRRCIPFSDYDGNAVVVVSVSDDAVDSGCLRELLATVEPSAKWGSPARIGLGSQCNRLEEIPRSYQEARVALFIATKLLPSYTRNVGFPAPESVTDRRIDAMVSFLDESVLSCDAEAVRKHWHELCHGSTDISVDLGRVAGCALLDIYNRLDEDELAFERLSERALPVAIALIRPVRPRDLARDLGELYAALIEVMLQSGRLHPSLAQRVAQFVRERYHQQISLKVLAGVFSVTPSYLGHVFREETGQAFSHYLNSIRLDRAKALLASSHLSAAQIARRIGYADPNYFYKKFREVFGISPAEYRESQ